MNKERKHTKFLHFRVDTVRAIVGYFIVFALTINVPVPFDKLFLPVLIGWAVYCGCRLSRLQTQVFTCFASLSFLSFAVNFPHSNIEILYPPLFFLAALFFFRLHFDLQMIRKILFVNILFGLVCALLAIGGIDTPFVRSLSEKGLPFLYAPLGFSPTNQVYGTFCILALLISFEYRKYDFLFFISIAALLLTMNRCSILFFMLLLLVYKRKLFVAIVLSSLLFIYKYWEDVNIFFSSGSLTSRSDLRKGVELSFWRSDDLQVLLFGRGNSHVSDLLTSKTFWEVSYIENGLDFILHCYGFVGLFFLLILLMCTFRILALRKEWSFLLFLAYYFLFEQWMTHECLTSSSMFLLGVLLSLIFNRKYNQKHGRFVNNYCNV